jgi:hypothetical protein
MQVSGMLPLPLRHTARSNSLWGFDLPRFQARSSSHIGPHARLLFDFSSLIPSPLRNRFCSGRCRHHGTKHHLLSRFQTPELKGMSRRRIIGLYMFYLKPHLAIGSNEFGCSFSSCSSETSFPFTSPLLFSLPHGDNEGPPTQRLLWLVPW